MRDRENDFGVCRACMLRDKCRRKLCGIINYILNGKDKLFRR